MAEDVVHYGQGRLKNGYIIAEVAVQAGNTAFFRIPRSVHEKTNAQCTLQYNLVTGQSITVFETNDDSSLIKIANFAGFSWTQIGAAGLTLLGSVIIQMPVTMVRVTTTGGATAGRVRMLA